MNLHKQCTLVFAKTLAAIMGIICLFQLIVDPYNISLLVTVKKINGHVPNLMNQNSLVKAAAIIRLKPDTILLGSSIVDSGFNLPGAVGHYDPWRRDNHLAEAKTPPVFNAGVRDGAIDDMFEMLKHASVNNPQLKKAIIGIEWSQINGLKRINTHEKPPLFGHTHLFPFAYQKYFTWTGLIDGIKTQIQSSSA